MPCSPRTMCTVCAGAGAGAAGHVVTCSFPLCLPGPHPPASLQFHLAPQNVSVPLGHAIQLAFVLCTDVEVPSDAQLVGHWPVHPWWGKTLRPAVVWRVQFKLPSTPITNHPQAANGIPGLRSLVLPELPARHGAGVCWANTTSAHVWTHCAVSTIGVPAGQQCRHAGWRGGWATVTGEAGVDWAGGRF